MAETPKAFSELTVARLDSTVDTRVMPLITQGIAEVHLGAARMSSVATPSAPPHLPYSHVTLGGVDAIVERLNGHPTHRETAL